MSIIYFNNDKHIKTAWKLSMFNYYFNRPIPNLDLKQTFYHLKRDSSYDRDDWFWVV